MRNEMISQALLVDELPEDDEFKISAYEWIVLSSSVLFIAALLVNAGWSYVLLITGQIEGGTPLGTIANMLHIHCLVCLV